MKPGRPHELCWIVIYNASQVCLCAVRFLISHWTKVEHWNQSFEGNWVLSLCGFMCSMSICGARMQEWFDCDLQNWQLYWVWLQLYSPVPSRCFELCSLQQDSHCVLWLLSQLGSYDKISKAMRHLTCCFTHYLNNIFSSTFFCRPSKRGWWVILAQFGSSWNFRHLTFWIFAFWNNITTGQLAAKGTCLDDEIEQS
jgi:hypothetical protein